MNTNKSIDDLEITLEELDNSFVQDKKSSKLSIIIVISTILYLVMVFLFLYIGMDRMRNLKPNEWGDFFAGIFSPLAFLWLIFGYYQQGQELKQNTNALNLQAKELKLSNLALKQQVLEMKNSVLAQQNMFELAEKQYKDSLEEKERNNKPKLVLIFSEYKYISQLTNSLMFTLNLNILNKGIGITDLKIVSNFWSMLPNNTGTLRERLVVENISFTEKIFIKLYRFTPEVPFTNNKLILTYKDTNGLKYKEVFEIIKKDEDVIAIPIK
ncbi:hypothetical protein Q5X71_16625 [Acinetobacter baumannii]|uniref:hypothetical protein n=1 Tax=Acinetobacter baumannii TaxID=470 RepID=UPI00233EA707|nr:hypothetical protein [Acinetobacter baumannii]MDC5402001.1 hypothetical protein [Acinetobacter baumannii]MDC5514425.1 hypothetical protein [Acinetobacter baumannii]MDK2107533.1 hypothetical protein [Acinetobacter baumannii]MDK2112868.1 hypothetical protein [Acinetobacter baumannii]MDK2142446.1 hypothetical protein [Acinetobacter baumannii]